MNSREFKYGNPSALFYRPFPFSIQIYENSIKKRKEIDRTSWKWFSNVKTKNFHFKKSLFNEFKGIEK